MTDKYRLYGTPTSYYTAKVRAYLNYKAIPFEEILTTEEIYRDVIVPRTGVWMIPTLISPDDNVVQDSTEIIDLLEQRFPDSSVCPTTPWQRIVARLLELCGDEWLIMTAIHYRWTKPENREFALAEFGRQARPNGTLEQQREAGIEKARVFGGWVRLFGIDDVTGPAIEEAYEELLVALEAHFRDHDFLLGSRPSVADFSFFGGLYAVLHRDPLSGRLMQAMAPGVVEWVDRLLHPKPLGGTFLANDAVPKTLDPVLRAIFQDQFPVLRDTVERVARWSAENSGEAFPKTIGSHDFELRGRRGTRRVYPYAQWMLQRALEAYRDVAPSERDVIDARLHELGGLEHMRIEPPQPVMRSNFNLVVAKA
jgi:glutathione S-transferase